MPAPLDGANAEATPPASPLHGDRSSMRCEGAARELAAYLETTERIEGERLQRLVCAFVDCYLEERHPPERVLVAFKAVLARIRWPRGSERSAQRRLTERMVTWCVERYFERRAEGPAV